MGRGIPIRLLLVILAMTAVTPLLVVVTIELISSYRSARHDAQTLARARAAAVRTELDTFIGGVDQVMRTVSQVASFTAADAERNNEILRTVKAGLPPWYANILLFTPTGEAVGLAAGDSTRLATVTVQEYFQRALQAQGLVAGVPTTSHATGDPVIHLARPIINSNGAVSGVIAVALRLDRLQELIETTELPAGSVNTLISGDGRVIARSEQPGSWVGKDVHAHPLVHRVLTERQGTAEIAGIDGRKRLYVFSTLDRVPWLLNAGIPISATFAPIRDEITREVAILLVALLLAAVGVTLTGRYITTSIARVGSAAATLTGGAWSTRVPVSGPVEVQGVANALNRLAETVESRIADLRQREAQMAGIVSSAMDAIITVDSEQRILIFNRAAEEMFGYDAAEMVGGPLDRLLPARTREVHRRHVQEFGETGVTRRSMGHLEPLTGLRADGTEFPIEATISQVEIGGQRQYTVILRDITERVRAEEERQRLLERERTARETAEATALRLRRLQSVTDAALSSLSLQGLLDELPARLCEAMQVDTIAVLLVDPGDGMLTTRAVVGVEDDVDHNVRIPFGAGFAGRVAQERRPIVEHSITRAGLIQTEFERAGLHSLLGVPLVAHGQVLGVLHAGRRGERRFTDEDTELLTLAAERMAIAFEHARLFEAEQAARAQAQTALSVRDEFLSAVSHELRTPLTSIVGFAQVLERRLERLDGPYRTSLAEGLSTIGANAQRMTALITDLLDVSRLQSGRSLQLDQEPLELDALVDAVIAEAHAAAPSHTFEVELPPEPMTGAFDRARLRRAISNILANAVKYSPGGGVISVRLAADPEGNTASLSVSDQGIGIPAEDLPHIFERFRRGTNVGGIWGAGIGLSLVRQIVEQHGGSVAVESAPDRGTTVTLRLPLRRQQPE